MENKNLPQVQKQAQLIAKAKLLIPHRPYLVEVIEQKKIKNHTPLEKENQSGALINYILALLGVSASAGDGKDLHYLAVEDFITTTLSNYTFGEIREAFKMLIKGDFKEDIKEVYNKLDCILVGKVMLAYDKEKDRIISGYYEKVKSKVLELEEKDNELSESEKEAIVKEGLIECFEFFVKNKKIEPCKAYIFDYLWERKLLVHFTNEDRNQKLEKARKVLKAQKIKTAKVSEYRQVLNRVKEVSIAGDIALAKEYVLVEYFQQLINDKLHIKDKL